MNTNLDQSLLQTKSGQIDYDMGGLPATAHADLAQQFGINKSRYFVHPLVETDYVALNTSRPTFGTANMRKAANYAIDRPACSASAAPSPASAPSRSCLRAWAASSDQGLPDPGLELREGQGARRSNCKSVNLLDGATRATGQDLGSGRSSTTCPQIGCDVNVKLFQGFQIYTPAGTKGADFDAVLVGWNQDYPDPYDFIDVLLNGDNIHDRTTTTSRTSTTPSSTRRWPLPTSSPATSATRRTATST